jgi:hypothetical protein
MRLGLRNPELTSIGGAAEFIVSDVDAGVKLDLKDGARHLRQTGCV